MSNIDILTQQILGQGTTGKWSGEGFGSAEANARDMAKILDGIGITNINQFGQFDTTVTQNKTVLPEYTWSYPGYGDTDVQSFTGRYYIPEYSIQGDSQVETGRTFVDPKYVTKNTGISGDSEWTSYTANLPTTQTVYGNKVTKQAVPNTYSERQTGNAWGGTFAGSGNTGYRVQFDSAGNPYFYTTGASSSDLGSILPIASLALSFAVPGLGSAIGSALGASGAAATALGNAVIGGVMSEASGGDFLQGALTSGAGSLLGGVVNPAVTEAVGSQAVGNALTSGVLSELQGGDFAQGALSGALSGAINDAKLAAAEEYLQSLPGGYDYENVPQPTEADVIQAFSELAPPPENLTQGVTDILNYAANAPAVQVAAAPNYVGELSGVQYDPNYVSDSETGAYRLEIGGTGDQQGTEPSLTTVPTQEQAQLQIDDLIAQLEPYLAQTPTLEDIQAIIGQQNFATPEDVQTAINSIAIPQGLSESDVQNIVSNALVNNPGLTAGDVQSIVDSAVSQIPSGLTAQDVTNILGQQNFATAEDIQTAINSIDIPRGLSEQDVQNIVSNAFANNPGLTANDVQSIVDSAVSQIPAGLTAQDVTNILGQQNFATPDDIRTAISGIQFPENMTPEDVQNIVSEAFQNNPGITATDVQDIVQGALNNLPEGLSADDVRNIVTEAVSSIPSAPTEQDIINIISGQNFATPEDIQTAINSIDIPRGLSEQDVQNIVSNAFANNPGLTANDVQTIVDSAVSQIPAGLTVQDVTDILGQQNFATPEDIQTAINSIDIPQGLTEQDVQSIVSDAFANNPSLTSSQVSQIVNDAISQIPTALNEAISAQSSEFGTALNQTTENILAQLAEQGTGLQTEFQTGLQDLADQLGISQQELQDQLNQYQEDWGTQLSGVQTGLQSQLTGIESSLAESTLANKLAMLDAMKAIGGLGLSLTGINGVMQSIKDQVTPKTYEFTSVDTSGWKSPVAANPVSWQAPAPINFGSQELLKGTQWQSPVSIGQVINTLNSTQPAPFVMPSFMSTFQGAPTVGATDIIGELGGKPVSIADIVAGIQSGQTYPGTVG